MMGFWEYIWPQEWILRFIIIGMWVVAVFVVRRCIKLQNIAKENLTMLEKTEDVSYLEKSLLQNHVNTNDCFTKYELEMGKAPITEVLFEHLRAIYDAGLKSSRLDADLLVKNSIDKIFTGVDFLKTSISLFLVIGILGTLAGLAISIGGFNGANFAVSGQTSTTAHELSTLFGNLRGAFAPSMWGVFFTITFVFVYTWFIQEGCINKLTEKLTINTIKNWLPVLYPTDFQRGDNSIVKLNATIKNAEGINKGVTDLQSNLTTSNTTLQELSHVSELIQGASQKFDKSTDKIMEIKKLYDQLRNCNDEFNQSIKTIVETATEERTNGYKEYLNQSQKNYNQMQKKSAEKERKLQEKVNTLSENMKIYFDQLTEAMKAQNEILKENTNSQQGKLEAVIIQLQSYDKNFFKNIQSLEEYLSVAVKNTADSVLKTNEATQILQESSAQLRSQNDKIIEGVSNPVKMQLKEMSTQLIQELQHISSTLNHMNKPLGAATEKMQEMLTKNLEMTRETVDKVIQNFKKDDKDNANLINSLHDNEKFVHSELQDLCKNINSSLQELNANIKPFVAGMAAKNGVDSEIVKEYMINRPQIQTIASNNGLEDKLTQIIQYMQRAEEKKGGRMTPLRTGFLKFTGKDIPIFIIAILLLFSFFMQGAIVYRIANLEKSQMAVNEVLIHGEMDTDKSNNPQNDE